MYLCIGLTIAQFLVAPYSLFVSFTLFVALSPPIYIAHLLSFLSIRSICSFLLSLLSSSPLYDIETISSSLNTLYPYCFLRIDLSFILSFFAIDQLLCWYCHLSRPRVVRTSTLTHVVWGFLNTKTYYLLLFAILQHYQSTIPLLFLLVDALLGVTPRVANMLSMYSNALGRALLPSASHGAFTACVRSVYVCM